MAHCRECNSEIVEAEAFCPHCGIALNPPGASMPADDEGASLNADDWAETVSEDTDEEEVAFDMAETVYASPDEIKPSTERAAIDAGKEESSEIVSDFEDSHEAQEVAGTGGDVELDEEASAIDSSAVTSPAGKVASTETGDDVSNSVSADSRAALEIEETEIEKAVLVTDEKPDLWTSEPGGEEAARQEAEVESLNTGQERAAIEEKSAAEKSSEAVSVEPDGHEVEAGDEEAESAVGSSVPEEEKLPEPRTGDSADADLPLVSASQGDEEVDLPKPADIQEPETSEDIAKLADATDIGEVTDSEPVAGSEAGFSGADEADAVPIAESQLEEEATAVESKPEETGKENAAEEQEQEGKSFTTPNIGGADTDGSKKPKLEPLKEGTILNERYEIVRKIGGGGMGAVYLASDKNLGGVLRAVKEMVQSYIEKEQQEKAVQDFKRESMLLTSLEHPSIPTIYDYFYDEQEARFYLVMKYISGGDLAARLRAAPEGRLDEISVTEWAIEIADVLDYLHNRQPPIVYRDLKPANIMVDGNTGKIMLIDFGIARWVNKEEKGVTAVGTMGYAPPELFSGNVVPSSDIYSLGSTMFHLLTGADPQNNPLLIFDFQKHPRPRQINPNLSDQIETILMRSVEYNADGRFRSAGELRDEMKSHLQKLKTGQVTYGIKESPKSVALSDQPVFCGFCGQKIVATDMFCAFCGAKQPLAQPGVQSQDYFLPQTTARLVVEGTGDLSAPIFDLAKKENLVGRRDPMSNIFPEVDLSKYDPQTKISRKHARIWRDGEAYLLEDLGSSNGTMVILSNRDTKRLAPHQAQMLKHGDKIQVGDTTLHFVLG